MNWKVIEYGPFVAIALIVGAVAGLLWLGRGNRYFLPRGRSGWVGAALALLIIASSALFLVFASYIRGVAEGAEEYTHAADQKAPPFRFELVPVGEEHALADYRGQVVLLNFWATWCAPCIKEMPLLGAVQEEYEDEGLRVIVVSDESREEIVAFFAERPRPFLSGRVEARTLEEPYTLVRRARPVAFLIDREGIIRETFFGLQSYDSLRQSIEQYL